MRRRHVWLVSSLLATLSLVACENAALRLQAQDTSTPGAQAPGEPGTDAKRRFIAAQGELARKAGRAPKHERDARTSQWQLARATPTVDGTFGEPQSAQTHFMAKRLPTGVATLSTDLYATALQQVAGMPTYSTRQGRVVASKAGVSSVVSTSSPAAQAMATGAVGASATGALAAAWEAMGPGNIGGRTRALLIHPTNHSTMWAGAVAGGIWKSTNGGTTWVPKADLLVNMAVNSMVYDPRNPDVLFAGTGEGFFNVDAVRGAGIMKSTDGGETWAQLPSTNNANFHYVQKLVVSRGNGARMYAATNTGIFRTTDGGATWTQMINATAVNGCMDLAIQTDRALANVFASCGTFAQATVYRALDTSSAQTWTSVMSVPNQGRTSLAIAPSNQSTIYAVPSHATTHAVLGVFRSTTNGSAGSFSQRLDTGAANPNRALNALLFTNPVIAQLTACNFGVSSNLTQGWYDQAVAVDPKNPDIVWVGGVDMFRSDDGGQNFGQASHWWFGRGVDPEYNHADHHILVFHPAYDGTSNKVMFSGNDGGLFKTSDARRPVAYSPLPITQASPVCGNTNPAQLVNWTELNNGYQVTQFYNGTHYPSGNTVFGGAQDNGTLRGGPAAPNAWTAIRGGDGGYVALNPNDTSMLWTNTTNMNMQRSTNGGVNGVGFTSGIGEGQGNFLFIAPYTLDPSNPANMWTAGAFPWRTTQANAVPTNGSIWSSAGAFFGQRIGAIAVAPSDSTRVYMGGGTGSVNNGRVFTTANALTATSTTAWTFSKPRPDSNFVSSLTVHPTLPGTVYATVSTFNSATGQGHVFRSTDFGATWTNVDGAGATGIPDVPVHTLVIDPNDTNRLYVGTDIGVFVSLDGGGTWARENTGFSNVIVEWMTIKNDAPRYLFAYTHGRSAYRVALP